MLYLIVCLTTLYCAGDGSVGRRFTNTGSVTMQRVVAGRRRASVWES